MGLLDFLVPDWLRGLFKDVEPREHTISRVLVLPDGRRDLGEVSIEAAQAEAIAALPPDTDYDVQSFIHYVDGSPSQMIEYHFRTPSKEA